MHASTVLKKFSMQEVLVHVTYAFQTVINEESSKL